VRDVLALTVSLAAACALPASAKADEGCPPSGLRAGEAIDQHVVYFPHGSADFSGCAWFDAVIRDAWRRAEASGAGLEISAYADRSGAEEHNRRLSERRAAAVRRRLTQLGLPASRIAVRAFGEDRPPVPTPDGAREPLNRLVHIRIVPSWPADERLGGDDGPLVDGRGAAAGGACG